MARSGTSFRTCNLCEAMCGVAITLDDEKIVSIKGDEQDTFSRGHICPKALALKDLYEDPDRLKKPMEKRDGQWHELDWETALDRVAERISDLQARHGKNALGVYLGNPNVHNLGGTLLNGGFLRALKTQNKFSATSVDQLPHHIVAWKLFGHQLRIPVPDIDRSDYFVIMGGNPLASNGSIMSVADVRGRLKAVKKRGKVVVIDPRRSQTAELADQHHFIRPGSDVLLLLAMLNHLFQSQQISLKACEGLLDTDPMTLASDFAPYTPERVAESTGISAAAIRQLVDEFCAAEAPVLYGRMGVSVQEFGALCQYLIMLFNILTGTLDKAGGLMFSTPAANILPQTGRGNMGRFHSRVRQLPEFNGELPVSALAEDIATPGDGQIKGMILVAGNPVLSTPNGEQLDRAFAGLDLLVSVDFYLNESSRHADFILPPVSPLEREHFDIIFNLLAVRNNARYAPALFKAGPDARHDWQILLGLRDRLAPPRSLKERLGRQLERRLGPGGMLALLLRRGPYGAGWQPFSGLTLAKLKAAPHGIDLGPLQPQLPAALFHKDRKIHLNTDFFLADLPRVDARFFGGDAQSPFVLIGRRDVRSNNSWLHNSQRLVKGKNRCTALLNPDDARRLGVSDAGKVRVHSRVGSVEVVAEVSDEVMPGVISIPHGWGHHGEGTAWRLAEANAGVSVNTLTDDYFIDVLSGNAALNGVPVSVEPISA